MDLDKIFLKGACPTAIGGQAVMEGVMMRGPDRTAVAIRLPDDRIHLKTFANSKTGTKLSKIPIIRGVMAFLSAMVTGTRTLFYSAKVLECSQVEEDEQQAGAFERWLNGKFGEKAAWNLMVYFSVILSLVITIAVFILFPTFVVGLLGYVTDSHFIMNLVEGILRLFIFLLYILAISKMEDIKRLFQYHGAEHKTIHCFENNLELTPQNAQSFYTLHPRCGTSFLMFVMFVSIVLFSTLGWPSLLWRIISRIVLIPVVAGISFELLKWAGRSDTAMVKILSLPGIYLQKITTKEPTEAQLEIAIVSMKAVLVDSNTPFIEGYVDENGELIEERIIQQ